MPCEGGTFQVDLDFIDHRALISKSDGRQDAIELRPMSVAAFYHELMAELERMEVPLEIHGEPNEVPDPIPFARNERDGAYQGDYVNRFWRVLSSSACVMEDFRGDFIGKCSPVHFFWGGMDLAVTRFSGARAPEHPGGIPHLPDWITREAYSHEVCSAGFWAGGSPRDDLRAFLASTYEAAAELGGWDRASLEWGTGGRPPVGGPATSPAP